MYWLVNNGICSWQQRRHWVQYGESSVRLQWRHNGRDGVSNHQPRHCLLNRSYRRRTKKTSKLRVTGLCEGNSPVTDEFTAQMASNAENVPFDDVIMNLRVVDLITFVLWWHPRDIGKNFWYYSPVIISRPKRNNSRTPVYKISDNKGVLQLFTRFHPLSYGVLE